MRWGFMRWFTLWLLVVSWAVTTRAELTVFRPNLGVPEFVEPGGAFTAEVRAGNGLSSNGWSVVVLNDLRGWTCTVEQVAYGYLVYNNSTTGYQLRVRTPSNLPPEVLRLAVAHPAAGAATNRHALSVVPCMETNFYLAHYADPQASASNALEASGKNTPYGSIAELYWHAPVFSVINPRFMLHTGDELDDGDVDTVNRYAQYLAAVDTFGPPLLITRGNNDRGDFGHWKACMGPACYHIRFGSFTVWMNDTRGNEMYAWFTNAYAASFADTNVRYRLLGQHFHNNADGKNPYCFAPTAGRYPDLMLVGHNHTFATLQTAPYPVLSSGPAHYYGAFGFFAFFRDGTNWICPGATNHPAGTGTYAVGDWGAPRVAVSYAQPNDGSAGTNTAIISNSLGFNFWDGRVRFRLRPATAGYLVSGGEKLAEYEYGGSNRAVVVRVNIGAATTTVVSVHPVPDFDGDGLGDEVDDDDDNDGMPDVWELGYGLSPTNAADAALDGDGDGLSNGDEYVAGTDPCDRADLFRILALSNVPPVCLYLPTVSGRWYGVYWREALPATGWHVLTSGVVGTTGVLAIPDGTAGTQRFYRAWVGQSP